MKRFTVHRDTAGVVFVKDNDEPPVKDNHRYVNIGGYLSDNRTDEAYRRANNVAKLLNDQHEAKEAKKQLSLI